MKKIKKKMLTLSVCLVTLASATMSLPASAADYYNWGPQYFTPDSGKFGALSTAVWVQNLKWGSRDLTTIADEQMEKQGGDLTVEYEFRPDIDMHGLWSGTTSFTSNLPSAFYEYQLFDHDDISIGSRKVVSCTTSTSYYGDLGLKAGNAASTAKSYVFESEYGIWLSGFSDIKNDSLPLAYEQYNNGEACNFGTSYTW